VKKEKKKLPKLTHDLPHPGIQPLTERYSTTGGVMPVRSGGGIEKKNVPELAVLAAMWKKKKMSPPNARLDKSSKHYSLFYPRKELQRIMKHWRRKEETPALTSLKGTEMTREGGAGPGRKKISPMARERSLVGMFFLRRDKKI